MPDLQKCLHCCFRAKISIVQTDSPAMIGIQKVAHGLKRLVNPGLDSSLEVAILISDCVLNSYERQFSKHCAVFVTFPTATVFGARAYFHRS